MSTEEHNPGDVRHVVRGQYAGYQDEPGVAPGSQTETMAAVRIEVDNWRWAGVPFLLRSGKRLAASRQLVTLGFHEPPLRMFLSTQPAPGTGGVTRSSSTSPIQAPSRLASWPRNLGPR